MGRWALGLGGLAAAFVAFVGVAHTPLGRPMLAWLQGAPGCPIGAELDPEAVAAVRARLTAPLRDESAEASSPVLGGLEPGQSSRGDVHRWSEHHGLRCSDTAARVETCRGALLGVERATVVLRFADDRLLDVEVAARTDGAAGALAIAETLDAQLGRGVPAFRADGANDASALRRGPLSQHRREYRFSDLRAEVRATNLGPRGFLVRGFAQSLAASG